MNRDTVKKFKKFASKFDCIISCFIYPLAKFAGRNKYYEKAILRPVMRSFTKQSNASYIRYTAVPKCIDKIEAYENADESFEEFAIVLQGPIMYEDNFTQDSVVLYKKLFPGVKIIVSTWQGVLEEFKDFCNKNNVFLLENTEPLKGGSLNINYQLTSSRNGVLKAMELKCNITIKSRTDQRLYARDLLRYLKNLLKLFPVKGEPKGRVIFTSYGMSYVSRPFCICDSFSAGYTEDIVNLYSVSLDERANDYHKQIQDDADMYAITLRDKCEPHRKVSPYEVIEDFGQAYYRYICPEEYITLNYCNNHCFLIDQSCNLIEAYRKFLKDYAIIVDDSQLMILWPKYIEYASQDVNEYEFHGKLDYKKWLDIYLNYTK